VRLEEVKLYRITHIKNIPHILRNGITHRHSANCNPDFINIGDRSLIDTRSNKHVLVDNGDISNPNTTTIVLGEFIPFYFGVKMPMLYVIQNGGNFVEKATLPKDIVYIVCSVIEIIKNGYNFYFTDGHATDNLTTFYDRNRINYLPSIIDWNSIRSSYWGGNDNLNIKRKKQAEFLISNEIDPKCIIGFGCFNEISRKTLIDLSVESEIVKIIPQAYY
jgi:ssDNA thymidine ADP-ribosyltransferase, DarT